VEPDRLSVAFEPTDKLVFVVTQHPNKGDVYSLFPEKKLKKEDDAPVSQTGFSSWRPIGRETNCDSTFNVFVKGDTPYLLVDYAGLKNIVVESRIVPGMRQGEK
jgi:hypothetical protein